MNLHTQLQTQLFELHSLQARLEALLEATAYSVPQLSVHVLESTHLSAQARLSIRLLSERRRLETREVVLERNQRSVQWLETFSFPVQSLDGELKVQVLASGQLQGTGTLRLSHILDQERHDNWLTVGRSEVRLAVRLIHSPEICFKHALQLVQTKIARTEMLLLSCKLETHAVELPVHCILAFKVARSRRLLKDMQFFQTLMQRLSRYLVTLSQTVSQRRCKAATRIAQAYRRYRQRELQRSQASPELDRVMSVTELSPESEQGEEAGRTEAGVLEAEVASDVQSESSSDSEINYYDPATANRLNRFRRR